MRTPTVSEAGSTNGILNAGSGVLFMNDCCDRSRYEFALDHLTLISNKDHSQHFDGGHEHVQQKGSEIPPMVWCINWLLIATEMSDDCQTYCTPWITRLALTPFPVSFVTIWILGATAGECGLRWLDLAWQLQRCWKDNLSALINDLDRSPWHVSVGFLWKILQGQTR